jgi:hypothetical protein
MAKPYRLASEKDVILAVVGASAGLGGFVLAFLALVMAAYTSDTRGLVLNKLLDMLAGVLAAFIVFLVDIAAGVTWLLVGGHSLYKAVLTGFFVGLLVLVGIAFYVTVGLIQHRPERG